MNKRIVSIGLKEEREALPIFSGANLESAATVTPEGEKSEVFQGRVRSKVVQSRDSHNIMRWNNKQQTPQKRRSHQGYICVMHN